MSSKTKKILQYVGIGVAALVVLIVISAIVVVRTDWFRNYVRQKIITATEESTGGTVTVGSFAFEWNHLRATVTDFVIHGKEPAGAAPFLRAARAEVDLRLFSSLKRIVDVSYLGVEALQANIIVFPDGSTNIPNPKEKKQSDTTPLETMVDLAVGQFKLTNGLIVFNSQATPFNIRGENLRAQLYYNLVGQSYQGQITLSPMYVVSGRNTPVKMDITLPVTLQRDRAQVTNAKIATALSEIVVNAAVSNLRDPHTTAKVNGHVALADVRALANVPMALEARGVPTELITDLNLTMDQKTIQVTTARLGLGSSNVEASGTLKHPSGQGALQFKTTLAMGELGRLLRVAAKPEGIVQMNGTAKLSGTSEYQVAGNITGKGLSFQQGANRISNVNLTSAITADPRRIDLKGLRLAAFGGEFAGDAAVENMARVHLAGQLRNLDLQNATRSLGIKNIPYDGVVSGPIEADADLKAPGTTGVHAKMNLAVASGRRGIPMTGRINAEYNGATDTVALANSYIALPHSRVNLTGSLGNRLNVQITSGDLNDILALIPAASRPHINVNRGTASFTGTITGRMTNPRIIGHLALTNFSYEGRPFNAFAADLDASSSGAAVQNGLLTRGVMQASFNGRVGLRNWKPESYEPVAVTASVRNGDLADIMALAGQNNPPYSGTLTADANITGTVGNPQGSANLTVLNGAAYGEPFDRIQAQVNMADQLVTIPTAFIAAGPARLQLNATFRHPRDSFSTGTLQAHLTSNQISLAQFQTIQKQRPGLAGTVSVNADVGATLNSVNGQSEFLLTSVSGDASARGLQMDGQNYGDFNATARTTGNTVRYQVASDFAGSNIRVNGDTQLSRGYPTNATASIANLPIERALAAARRQDIPAKGNLSGTASFAGTMENPQGSANVTIANAVIYDEPLDRIRANVNYTPDAVDLPLLEVVAGPSNITLSGRYDHPKGNLQAGHLRFNVNSSDIQLAQIRNIQKTRPGLAGLLHVKANGDATVQEKQPRVLFSDLNADVAATGLRAAQKNFGDLTLAARTSGQTLNFNLDSNLVQASIHGRGTAQLQGDHPLTAQVTFSNVMWSNVEAFLGSQTTTPPSFDAVADGQVSISGPVTNVDQLRGTLQLSRLQLNTIPTPGSNQKMIALQNQGPIVLALNSSAVRVQSAHLTGPGTDITATGDIGLKGQTAMNLTLNANTNLSLLQDVNRDIFSSGNVVVNATVRGTPSSPLMNGRVELKNASFNMIDMPNGISNANGVILLSGTTATIQSFTGESGGGTVTLGGFVTYSAGNLRMGLNGNGRNVRVRYPQGTTVVANTNVTLTGTRQNSLLSGNVIIQRIGFAPQNDFGSMLSSAAPPVQSPSGEGPFDNMRLDVRIRTSPAVAVQASLAQNIQADADLRLRGTVAVPGMLGRINITSGNLVFFGTKYTVNQGAVSFFNPTKIQPILNVSLETVAKGVDVVLTVTGPIDNMKLTYTSDPPLQFQEIVSLLAAGRTPTSDPTLLANQPTPPAQSYQQMGESALVSQAIANPVSSRLQRVFGVNQLKIDPTFTSGSELPQARLTLQQQVASNLTFTYVTNLSNTNSQIIRIEWALNPQWSAIATRDENGRFGIDFFYKKQFR